MKQHQPKVVVAAKGVVPRQPVHQYRWLLRQHRHRLRHLLLVGTHHALGVDDGFGQFGRATGEQELDDRVWSGGLHRCVNLWRDLRGQQVGKCSDGAAIQLARAQYHFDVARNGRMDGLGIAHAVSGKHKSGRGGFEHVAQLVKVLTDQRIRRRHRYKRHASEHAA